MTDLSYLNQQSLNLKAADYLKQLNSPINSKTELAVARLMVWGIWENLIDQELPWWREVGNFSDKYVTWAQLILELERTNPKLLMQFLTEIYGEQNYIDLDNLTPEEAAETLLEELITSIEAQPEKLEEA